MAGTTGTDARSAAKRPDADAADAADAEAPRSGRRLLGEILVERRQLTPAQLSEALLQQRVSGKRLGNLLVELGALDERDLAEALGEHFALPVVDLRQRSPEASAIALVPEPVARALGVVPLRADDGELEVAVADPGEDIRAQLATTAGLPVRFVVASASDIRRATDRSYRALAGIEQLIGAFQQAVPEPARALTSATPLSGESAPVVELVSRLLAQAARDRASDVHLEPMADVARVRFRIDGVLHDVLQLPLGMGAAVISRIKVLAGMNIVERRRPQDGQFAASMDGRDVDIRVAATGTVSGEKVVMRMLDKSRPRFRLSDLGMPAATYQRYAELVRSPFGMIVCAGPTGSGKTTSLYATLTELNSVERNIVTIEDPVEYVFPTINQIQINEAAGITFAGGLRSILRQDPDVILVGEMRDAETARIAVQAALTGHFVLSSLHATDAPSALVRILEMGVEPFIVSSAVLAVLSQRLVRRICEQCTTSYRPTSDELAFYEKSGGQPPADGFMHGAGCTFCAQTGYSDRIGVYELLRVTPEVKGLIAAGAPQEEVRSLAASQDMRTLRQEAIDLVAAGTTTIAEVVRSIYLL